MSSRWLVSASDIYRSSSTLFVSNRDFNTDQIIQYEKLTVIHQYPVLLCLLEKIILIIDYCQVFGLYWVMAQPWPWPYLWINYSYFTVFFNFDVFSTTLHGALRGKTSIASYKWGYMNNYCSYALIFSLIQSILFISLCILIYHPYDRYGKMHNKKLESKAISVVLLFSYILYLPANLAVFRLYYCESNPYVLSSDPTVVCQSVEHATYLIICSLLTLPVVVGLPYQLYRYISTAIIYRSTLDHEKRIQVWELLHMFNLDEYWLENQLWLTTSFTKYGSYYYLSITILKLWLLVIFIFLRFDLQVQSAMCCFSTLVFCSYYIIPGMVIKTEFLPYRNYTANIILICVFISWIVSSTFGMANSFKVRNAVMVASTESIFLLTTNSILWITILCSCLYTAFISSKYCYDWPSMYTLHHIQHNPELLPKVSYWIDLLRDSIIIRDDFMLTPVDVADINILEDAIRALRNCWLSAKACGSIFELAISEYLEELLYIHATRIPDALRKHPYWDNEYSDPSSRKRIQQRYYTHAMMAPKKRRILFKLLAYRFFSSAYIDKSDQDCRFDVELAMKQIELNRIEEEKRERAKVRAEKRREAIREMRKQIIADHRKKIERMRYKQIFDRLTFGLFKSDDDKESDDQDDGSDYDDCSSNFNSLLGNDGNIIDDINDDIDKLGFDDDDGDDDDNDGIDVTGNGGGKANAHGTNDVVQDVDTDGKPIQLNDSRGNNYGVVSTNEATMDPIIIESKFSQAMIDDAIVMIIKLKERTELALNKHHHSKVKLLNKTFDQNQDIYEKTTRAMGELTKITTMELIKETVDDEEKKDLEELYFLWDEAIQLYELEEFPGIMMMMMISNDVDEDEDSHFDDGNHNGY